MGAAAIVCAIAARDKSLDSARRRSPSILDPPSLSRSTAQQSIPELAHNTRVAFSTRVPSLLPFAGLLPFLGRFPPLVMHEPSSASYGQMQSSPIATNAAKGGPAAASTSGGQQELLRSSGSTASSSPDASPPRSHAASLLLADDGLSTNGEFEQRARASSASTAAAPAAASAASSTRRHTDDGLSDATSSSFIPRETHGNPASTDGSELLIDDAAANAPVAAVPVSASPPIGQRVEEMLVRATRSCTPRELRLLFMLLPCVTVVLFATKQNTAAFVMLSLTLLMFAAIIARLLQLLRTRRRLQQWQQPYQHLDPEEAVGAEQEMVSMQSLGAALGFAAGSGRHGRHSERYHRSSLLHPAARNNPIALRLALADRDFGPNDYELLCRLDAEHQAQVFTGIPASAIERLPTYKVPKSAASSSSSSTASKEANLCSICLEDKTEGQTVRALLCLHTFHAVRRKLSQRACGRIVLERLTISVFALLLAHVCAGMHRSLAAGAHQVPRLSI